MSNERNRVTLWRSCGRIRGAEELGSHDSRWRTHHPRHGWLECCHGWRRQTERERGFSPTGEGCVWIRLNVSSTLVGRCTDVRPERESDGSFTPHPPDRSESGSHEQRRVQTKNTKLFATLVFPKVRRLLPRVSPLSMCPYKI